jgi:hypothetical protein
MPREPSAPGEVAVKGVACVREGDGQHLRVVAASARG